MLFNLSKGAFTARSFQYSGNSDFDRAGTDFMFVLEDSNANGSTLRLFKTIANADICLVAGGLPGGGGQTSDRHGGYGGEVLNVANVSLPSGDYIVTVGESGGNTTLVAPDGRTWTAVSGNGSAGGTGGVNAEGKPGVAAWGDLNTLLRRGWLYGAGGGRGVERNSWGGVEASSAKGGSIGTASDDDTCGRGGTDDHHDGYPGFPGTGQGGGGVGSYATQWEGNVGPGGRGAVLIRKHKEANA